MGPIVCLPMADPHRSVLLSAADTWLHFVTSPVPLYEALSVNPGPFSIAEDPAACAHPNFTDTCIETILVNSGPGTPSYYYGTIPNDLGVAGDAVASGNGSTVEVITLSSTIGPLAVVIVPPSNVPQNARFNAQTFGMIASCDKNPSCSHAYYEFNTPSVVCNITASNSTDQRVLNTTVSYDGKRNAVMEALLYPLQEASNTVSTSFDGFGHGVTNPFGFSATAIFWFTQNSNVENDMINGTYAYSFYSGNCKVHIYDVTLAYSDGAYAIQSQQLADESTRSWLFAPFVEQFGTYWLLPKLALNIFHHVNDTNFSAALSGQISTLGLAYSAGTLKPVTTDVAFVVPFTGGRYPVSALAFLWTSAVLYILVSIALLLDAVALTGDEILIRKSDEDSNVENVTSTLDLAYQRLANPLAVVAEHFVLSPGNERHHGADLDAAALSVQGGPMAMFPNENPDTTRLRMGFVGDDDDVIQGEATHNSKEKGDMPFKVTY